VIQHCASPKGTGLRAKHSAFHECFALGSYAQHRLSFEVLVQTTMSQNGIVESNDHIALRSCAHRLRFETLQHASRVAGARIGVTTTGQYILGTEPRKIYPLAADPGRNR
jgi:hypothetical protein